MANKKQLGKADPADITRKPLERTPQILGRFNDLRIILVGYGSSLTLTPPKLSMNPLERERARRALNTALLNTSLYFLAGWVAIYVALWSKNSDWMTFGTLMLALLSPAYLVFLKAVAKPTGWTGLVTHANPEPRIERDTRMVTLGSLINAGSAFILWLLGAMTDAQALIGLCGAIATWLFIYQLNLVSNMDEAF